MEELNIMDASTTAPCYKIIDGEIGNCASLKYFSKKKERKKERQT